MKAKFLYTAGTGFYINNLHGISIDLTGTVRWQGKVIGGEQEGLVGRINGLDGRYEYWNVKSPASDPFPKLLDPTVWDAKSVDYPAAFFGGTGFLGTGFSMGAGINVGVDRMVKEIKALGDDQPFGLGGYSQGAAVISSLYLMGLQEGTTGELEDYRDRFLGGVCFGNPRKQRDYLGVYGSWSGSWDVPGSNSDGGGAFPSAGSWRRLTGCEPDKWLEFSAPADIFSAVGTSWIGEGFNNAIDAFLDLTRSQVITTFFSGGLDDALTATALAMGDPGMVPEWVDIPEELRGETCVGGRVGYYVDGDGIPYEFPGGGHVSYPSLPPCDLDGTWDSSTVPVEPGDGKTYLKAVNETCYQLGLRFLEERAAARGAGPIILPSTPGSPATSGWSTTLTTPAA